jgi:hypothetical protein
MGELPKCVEFFRKPWQQKTDKAARQRNSESARLASTKKGHFELEAAAPLNWIHLGSLPSGLLPWRDNALNFFFCIRRDCLPTFSALSLRSVSILAWHSSFFSGSSDAYDIFLRVFLFFIIGFWIRQVWIHLTEGSMFTRMHQRSS